MPREVGRGRRGAVADAEVPGAAEVHRVRVVDHRAHDRPRRGVLAGRVLQQGQGLERAAGALPPVGVALVDRAVGGQGRQVVAEAGGHPRHDRVALRRLEQRPARRSARSRGSRRSSCSAAGPSQPQSSRATNGSSTRVRTSCRIRRAQTGDAVVELVAEHVVDPGQPRGHLAGAEVEHGLGDDRDDRAEGGGRDVVRGPAPRALLAQQGHAVGDLVDPPGSSVTSAATTARVSRSSRPNTWASYSTRSPSRRYRAYWLARGCGQGVPRSACARREEPTVVDGRPERAVGRQREPSTHGCRHESSIRIGDDRK